MDDDDDCNSADPLVMGLALQLDLEHPSDNVGLGGPAAASFLDWLPPLQPADLDAIAGSNGDDSGLETVSRLRNGSSSSSSRTVTNSRAGDERSMKDEDPICTSPVFSDSSDLEECNDAEYANGVGAEYPQAPEQEKSQWVSQHRGRTDLLPPPPSPRQITFGLVQTRLLITTSSCEHQVCDGCGSGGGVLSLEEEDAEAVGEDTVVLGNCVAESPVKVDDGPSPSSLLLEGLIRRHHAGTLDGGAATLLAACGPAGRQWLGVAATRLAGLLEQIENDGSCGILPSMIRLTAEHTAWLQELLSLITGALTLLPQQAEIECNPNCGPVGPGVSYEREQHEWDTAGAAARGAKRQRC